MKKLFRKFMNLFSRKKSSEPEVSFHELKLDISEDELTSEFLESLKIELAEVLNISVEDIAFLGFRESE